MPQSKIRRYLRHGTLPQLAVFEAVARLGGFTRAAEELYMAQPTVSVQIKKLTETIGLPVLEQVGKTVRLTPVGRELQGACSEIFAALTRFEQRVADLRGMQAGTLHIGSSTVAKYFTTRQVSEFLKSYPGIDVKMHVGHRQSLLDRMASNADDLYVLMEPPTDGDFVTLSVLPNPIEVFAPADHPLAEEKAIPFERLSRESIIVREQGSGTRMTVEQLFREHNVQPNIRMELASNEAIGEAIRCGMGVSIMSRQAVGYDMQAGLTTLDVVGFPLMAHWHVVYPAGKQLPVVAQSFVDFLRNQVAGT
jgi:LysR family transcriptional regulator, low CO2-responsive transcriptional regulator